MQELDRGRLPIILPVEIVCCFLCRTVEFCFVFCCKDFSLLLEELEDTEEECEFLDFVLVFEELEHKFLDLVLLFEELERAFLDFLLLSEEVENELEDLADLSRDL